MLQMQKTLSAGFSTVKYITVTCIPEGLVHCRVPHVLLNEPKSSVPLVWAECHLSFPGAPQLLSASSAWHVAFCSNLRVQGHGHTNMIRPN